MSLNSAFEELWSGLGRIGRDDATGGYARFAWTEVDLTLRAWFRDQAGSLGLAVEQDRNGNQWAWWGKPGPGAVVTGSHLDSVPGGGAYDGPLGVLSGLLAVDRLRSRGVRPSRPVAVVNFADEEGARFGVACIGSQLMTGVLPPDRARALTDAGGTTLAEAMTAAGADPDALGRDDQALERIGTFVELHVEQGIDLAERNAAVGVASAIWPHGRWRCSFAGEGNHAGTTRLADRHDPMLPFASTVLAAREVAERVGGVATFGRVRVQPGGTNVIASAVDGWLDSRAPAEATVRALVDGVADAARAAATRHGVDFTLTEESWSPVVDFRPQLRDRLAAVLGGAPVLPTGAGHDAGVLAAHVPSAMLFVRNPTGVSHSPAEHADAADCIAGIEALAAVLEDLVTA
jgi:N-carbamoyl-L-amino-acid hydrolase